MPQRSQEFQTGTGRDFAKSRDPRIFRDGIHLIISSRDLLEVFRDFSGLASLLQLVINPENLSQLIWFFSCPSSSIPTLEINYTDRLLWNLEPSRLKRTKPTWPIYPTYFPDPPELPIHLTYPPTWHNHPSVLPTQLIYPPTQITSQNRQITHR